MNAKVTFIQQLHQIYLSGTRSKVQPRMDALLKDRSIGFQHFQETPSNWYIADTTDMRGCFYDDIFSDKNANALQFFAVKVEVYLDLSTITATLYPFVFPVSPFANRLNVRA